MAGMAATLGRLDYTRAGEAFARCAACPAFRGPARPTRDAARADLAAHRAKAHPDLALVAARMSRYHARRRLEVTT